MRILSKKCFKKVSGGAVMLQVLLGLGLMVIMSPMIFTQIKKYNEEVKREEVVNHLESWQKAASSFVVFEKDRVGAVPEGTSTWEGDSLKNLLRDYMGSASVPTTNGFGQRYALITIRHGEQIEAVVYAYDGGLDKLTLNGIGQFLFDKGAVMDDEGVILSDLKLSNDLTNFLKTKVSAPLGSSGGGLLFMYVSDAFFTSDYLHIAPMPGSSERASLVNTMIVDLDMGGNSIGNVKNFYATALEGSNAYVNDLSVSDLEFKSPSTVNGNFEYQNIDGISGNEFPAKTIDGAIEESSHRVEVEDLTVDDANLKKVYIEDGELETKDLSAKNFYVRGDVKVNNGWNNNMIINSITANIFSSENGNLTDNISTIVLDPPLVTSDKIEDSFIYVGSYTKDASTGDVTYSTSEGGDALILNLAGVSEVNDICFGTATHGTYINNDVNKPNPNCLSGRIVKIYNELMANVADYIEAAQAKEDAKKNG